MSGHADDLRLARRVADGDAVAGATLAERLAPRARRLARTLAGQCADWEDAAQCSLIEILRSTHRYGGRSSLERWADRITVRTTLRMVRSTRAREQREDGTIEELPSANQAPSSGELDRHLAALPPERRDVVVLRHVFGFGIDEIAQLTGVSRNTVKDRLVHGRRQLRERVRRAELGPRLVVVGGRS